MNTAIEYIIFVVGAAAIAAQALRYLRVAQREHYIPFYTVRFAYRWQKSSYQNEVLFSSALLAGVIAIFYYQVAVIAALAAIVMPLGLSLKGRTSKLNWTRRLKTTAVALSCLVFLPAIAVVLSFGLKALDAALVLTALAIPAFLDAALFLLLPLEKKLAKKYIDSAKAKLQKADPLVVAITGSYGKTSTKTYLAHLLKDKYQILASPKSFNNKIGLAKTVNEGLFPSTEVFIAEMGIFGPGEIREMCSWVVPKIAAITAVGPVHLERFGSVEKIAEAKAEITEKADTVVLNIDNPYLAKLYRSLQDSGKKLVSVSEEDESADICIKYTDSLSFASDQPVPETGEENSGVSAIKNSSTPGKTFGRRLSVFSKNKHLLSLDAGISDKGIALTNIAVALAIALELKCPLEQTAAKLVDLPQASNRLNVERLPGDITVLDDTYNSNPKGASLALETMSFITSDTRGKKILVTPGMIELGPEQFQANEEFSYQACALVTHFLIVNSTNKKALEAGIKKYKSTGLSSPEVFRYKTREEAVRFVKSLLQAGDVVLYENDLPDHYP